MKRLTRLAAAAALALSAGISAGAIAHAQETIKFGFIGSFASDAGRSTMRGAEIAIEEINAAGGILGGKKIELVKADSGEDPTEGIKAYEYLAETEKVQFIVSGSIDDVSLAWLPRMTEYQIPTLDTWTSSIAIINKLVEDYETHKMYFMNVATDEALATLYVDFGKDVLAGKMGWKKTVILQEDTAFGEAINGLVTQLLAPEAGIEVLDTIKYDVATVDFSPIFSRAVDSGADFIYIISSVNSQVVSSQYVKLQVRQRRRARPGIAGAAMSPPTASSRPSSMSAAPAPPSGLPSRFGARATRASGRSAGSRCPLRFSRSTSRSSSGSPWR